MVHRAQGHKHRPVGEERAVPCPIKLVITLASEVLGESSPGRIGKIWLLDRKGSPIRGRG